MLWTIRNLLDIINSIRGKEVDTKRFSDYFEIDLPLTQIYHYLKSHKQYTFYRDIPHGSCLYEICENTVLMVEGISKALKNDTKDPPTNPHDIVEYSSCDSNDKSCMLSECKKCKTSNLNLEDFDKDEHENEESCSDSIDNENSANICFTNGNVQMVRY